MSDSIDKQKVLATLDFADNALTDEERTVENYKELLTECIKVLPTAENNGEWIPLQGLVPYKWRCNKCEKMFKTDFNYCPNCGARMKESEDRE